MTKSSSSREIPFLCCSEIEKQEPFNSCPHSIAAPNQKNDRGGEGERRKANKKTKMCSRYIWKEGKRPRGRGRQSHCSIKIVNAAEAAKGDQGILLYETSFLQVNWRRLLPKKERGGGGSRSRDQRRPARQGIPSRADGDEKSLCPSSFFFRRRVAEEERAQLLLLGLTSTK